MDIVKEIHHIKHAYCRSDKLLIHEKCDASYQTCIQLPVLGKRNKCTEVHRKGMWQLFLIFVYSQNFDILKGKKTLKKDLQVIYLSLKFYSMKDLCWAIARSLLS